VVAARKKQAVYTLLTVSNSLSYADTLVKELSAAGVDVRKEVQIGKRTGRRVYKVEISSSDFAKAKEALGIGGGGEEAAEAGGAGDLGF